MKKTLFLIFIIHSLLASAQQLQFNNMYYPDTYNVGGTVFCNDSVYYLVGSQPSDDLAYSDMTVWKFDSLGNYLLKKSCGDEYYKWSLNIENTCIRSFEGYVATGSKGHFSLPYELGIMLYKFDAEFDTLWTKNYFQDSVYKVSHAIVNCNDGGYAIVGSTRKEMITNEVLDEEKAFVLRTDSEGNMLWYKTYGTLDYDDRFFKVVQTPDGGFLCGGVTKSYNSHSWDWYLVKVDFDGNEEWYRTYGDEYYDDGRIMGITMTSDTSYIITGAINISADIEQPYIIKLDENFDLELSKLLPYPASSSLTGQVLEIEDNQFVAIGSDRINTYNNTQTTLTKFDSELEIIWRRKYTAGDTTETENKIYSVDTCGDGGYVLGGWAQHFGQKLALIKTDSLGCDGTDWWECSSSVTIKEYASNPEFYMYPNPTAKGSNIQCVINNAQLDPEPVEGSTIEIYNLTGLLLKETVIAVDVR